MKNPQSTNREKIKTTQEKIVSLFGVQRHNKKKDGELGGGGGVGGRGMRWL